MVPPPTVPPFPLTLGATHTVARAPRNPSAATSISSVAVVPLTRSTHRASQGGEEVSGVVCWRPRALYLPGALARVRAAVAVRLAELHIVDVARASTLVPQIDPLCHKTRSRLKRTPIRAP
jgi:hypothetical protein